MDKSRPSENRIAYKLRSEQGASITFALLLFLVCAALSAVVLVAATTTAGRIKNIAESDQKYYALMSASEFINAELDGQTISTVAVNGGAGKSFAKPMNRITGKDLDRIETVIDADSVENGGFDDDDEEVEKINTDSESQDTPSEEAGGFAAVLTDLYNGDSPSGSYTLKFAKTGAPSALESMNVTAGASVDRDAHSVTLTLSADGSTNGMVLIYSVEKDTDKHPPVTKVKEDGVDPPREVTSSYETTWHLVSMKSGFDDMGDI